MHVCVRVQVRPKAVNRERVRAQPRPEIRRIVPRPEVRDAQRDILFLPGELELLPEVIPARRTVVRRNPSERRIRRSLDELARRLIDDARRGPQVVGHLQEDVLRDGARRRHRIAGRVSDSPERRPTRDERDLVGRCRAVVVGRALLPEGRLVQPEGRKDIDGIGLVVHGAGERRANRSLAARVVNEADVRIRRQRVRDRNASTEFCAETLRRDDAVVPLNADEVADLVPRVVDSQIAAGRRLTSGVPIDDEGCEVTRCVVLCTELLLSRSGSDRQVGSC